MAAGLSLIELVEFTDWERSKWYDWFQDRRDTALTISTGPNGDRFPTVGELVKHILSQKNTTLTGFQIGR